LTVVVSSIESLLSDLFRKNFWTLFQLLKISSKFMSVS
jgi:hypothetical protein